jgi:hypothetical protein
MEQVEVEVKEKNLTFSTFTCECSEQIPLPVFRKAEA